MNTLHTRNISIKNTGRETATKIELVFNYQPTCFNLDPIRHYTKYEEPDKRYVVVFDSLAPGETIGCALMEIQRNIPNLINLRSDQCGYEEVPMALQPIINSKIKMLYKFLELLGMGTAIYFFLLFFQLLIS